MQLSWGAGMNQQWMQKILKVYGQAVVIHGMTADLSVRAFLQPVTEKDEAEPFVMTALGSVDDRLWRYLGLTPLETTDVVEHGGVRFCVRSCRPFYVGEDVIYWWGMLAPERKAAE